jgi:hydroxymethylpyrimidine pyrophosphatase-like HAD family hydrolase
LISDFVFVLFFADGKSLGFALDKSTSNIKGSITLAIGDGANDVSMIQATHFQV